MAAGVSNAFFFKSADGLARATNEAEYATELENAWQTAFNDRTYTWVYSTYNYIYIADGFCPATFYDAQ